MQYKQFVSHSSEMIGGEKCDAYGTEDIAAFNEALENEKLANHAFIIRVMGHLLGKVLTTVEATTANTAQAKAIKDLMRGHFSKEMEFVSGMLFDQEVLKDLAGESLEGVPDEEIFSISIDEALGEEPRN